MTKKEEREAKKLEKLRLEKERMYEMFSFEREYGNHQAICGIDDFHILFQKKTSHTFFLLKENMEIIRRFVELMKLEEDHLQDLLLRLQ